MRIPPLLLLVLALAGCTHAPADTSPAVTLSRLRGPVYVAVDTFFTPENSVVYVGERGVTVVGATWTPQTAAMLHREIRKVTSLPVVDVVLTHHHADRAGGAAYWSSIGAAVLATQQTDRLLEQKWPAALAALRESYAAFPAISTPRPTRTYSGDFSTQDGNVRAMYLGPSHTEDGLFVYFPAQKILFGDCILKEHLGNLDDANLAEYPKTLERLQELQLPVELIVAGHWTPVHGPELLPAFLEMLRQDTGPRR